MGTELGPLACESRAFPVSYGIYDLADHFEHFWMSLLLESDLGMIGSAEEELGLGSQVTC